MIFVSDIYKQTNRATVPCDIIAAIGRQAEAARPSLEALLSAPDPTLRAHAAAALFRIGFVSEQAVVVLVETIPSSNDFSFSTLHELLRVHPQFQPVYDRAVSNNPAVQRSLNNRAAIFKRVARWTSERSEK